jgi:hypothetical protein
MSDVYYVVTRENGNDDSAYLAAVAFNRSDKDSDNEAEANAYASERKVTAPWHSHSVMTADDFGALADKTDDGSDTATDDTATD